VGEREEHGVPAKIAGKKATLAAINP